MIGIAGHEVLMIGPGILEAGERLHLGHDRIAPQPRLLQLRQIGARCLVLLWIEREERAAILGAAVGPLIIERGRIGDDREEDAQQRAIADDLRIIGDPDRLGETGIAAADHVIIDLAVARAAGEPRHGELHTLHMGKNALDTPIAAAREDRGFQRSARLRIQRRNRCGDGRFDMQWGRRGGERRKGK